MTTSFLGRAGHVPESTAFPSRRRPVALRRSWLFVPGLDATVQARALASGADVIVADLEEFTRPEDCPAARRRIVDLMRECRARGIVGAVRVNMLENDGLADLEGVLPGTPDVVFLPHAEHAAQISALDAALTALEAMHGWPAGCTEVVPTLESARGVVGIGAILAASARVSACLLAAEDLSADLGAVRGPDGLELHHLRARFLVDCIAAGKAPIDCPFSWRDPGAVAADLAWAVRIGLKAKCTVYPEQVSAIHEALTPSASAVTLAQACVRRYERSRAAGGSDADATPVDPPDYHTARRLLTRHARFQAWADGPASFIPNTKDST